MNLANDMVFGGKNGKHLMKKKKVQLFNDFIQIKKKVRYSAKKRTELKRPIKSTYCNFSVPPLKMAKNPGQKTRVKPTKTKVKFSC